MREELGDAPVGPDVIETGPDRPRRRWPWVAVVVALALVVTGFHVEPPIKRHFERSELHALVAAWRNALAIESAGDEVVHAITTAAAPTDAATSTPVVAAADRATADRLAALRSRVAGVHAWFHRERVLRAQMLRVLDTEIQRIRGAAPTPARPATTRLADENAFETVAASALHDAYELRTTVDIETSSTPHLDVPGVAGYLHRIDRWLDEPTGGVRLVVGYNSAQQLLNIDASNVSVPPRWALGDIGFSTWFPVSHGVVLSAGRVRIVRPGLLPVHLPGDRALAGPGHDVMWLVRDRPGEVRLADRVGRLRGPWTKLPPRTQAIDAVGQRLVLRGLGSTSADGEPIPFSDPAEARTTDLETFDPRSGASSIITDHCGAVLGTGPHTVVWGPCRHGRAIHLTDTSTGATHAVRMPVGASPAQAQCDAASPDGRWVALWAARHYAFGPATLAVLDVRSSRLHIVDAIRATGGGCVGWTADSTRLFSVLDSAGLATYVPATGQAVDLRYRDPGNVNLVVFGPRSRR